MKLRTFSNFVGIFKILKIDPAFSYKLIKAKALSCDQVTVFNWRTNSKNVLGKNPMRKKSHVGKNPMRKKSHEEKIP